MTGKQKDVLYWIAAVGIFLLMMASQVAIVNPETGEGWNPIIWVLQMGTGVLVILAVILWIWDNLIVRPIKWLWSLLHPEYNYPRWYRKHFLRTLRPLKSKKPLS